MFVPSASPKMLNLNQDHLSQKAVFLVKPYKIKVVITSLIEILEFWSHEQIYSIV